MPILGAYLLPHPPLAIPAVGQGNEEAIGETISAMQQAAEEIARLAPETIVYITPHATTYSDYFHISPGEGGEGDFSRFGSPEARLKLEYDTVFNDAVIAAALARGVPAGYDGERDAALDHGVMVPAWYICYNSCKISRVSQSGLDAAAHYRLGQAIADAAVQTGRKTIIIASGDLSHKLGGSYGYAAEGTQYDALITQRVCAAGEFNLLFDADTQALRKKAAECAHGSLAVMAGCLHGIPAENELLSYQGPFGVGYAVARFVPPRGDDPYRRLARQSLEYAVKTNKHMPMPDGLPPEMLNTRAGAFVSLHKHGQLRGCIGTIFPTTHCVAAEIIQNAVSAGLSDLRFNAVTQGELEELTYKVDILAAPEPITDPSQLDVKRYGVIVSAGGRRGLLLPNLDGIDTVEAQIAIARQKAGIPANEPIKLERFEVTRYA